MHILIKFYEEVINISIKKFARHIL